MSDHIKGTHVNARSLISIRFSCKLFLFITYLACHDSLTDLWTAALLLIGLDWIEQCLTSPPTQYRLYGRRFLQVKRPNQQYQKYWRNI